MFSKHLFWFSKRTKAQWAYREYQIQDSKFPGRDRLAWRDRTSSYFKARFDWNRDRNHSWPLPLLPATLWALLRVLVQSRSYLWLWCCLSLTRGCHAQPDYWCQSVLDFGLFRLQFRVTIIQVNEVEATKSFQRSGLTKLGVQILEGFLLRPLAPYSSLRNPRSSAGCKSFTRWDSEIG